MLMMIVNILVQNLHKTHKRLQPLRRKSKGNRKKKFYALFPLKKTKENIHLHAIMMSTIKAMKKIKIQ